MPWIYRWLRADGEEIDAGPYSSRLEALEDRNMHKCWGALCVGPIAVDDDYEMNVGNDEVTLADELLEIAMDCAAGGWVTNHAAVYASCAGHLLDVSGGSPEKALSKVKQWFSGDLEGLGSHFLEFAEHIMKMSQMSLAKKDLEAYVERKQEEHDELIREETEFWRRIDEMAEPGEPEFVDMGREVDHVIERPSPKSVTRGIFVPLDEDVMEGEGGVRISCDDDDFDVVITSQTEDEVTVRITQKPNRRTGTVLVMFPTEDEEEA